MTSIPKERKAPVTDASDFLPEEAVAKAAEEGLTLVSARSETGYLHVYLSAKGGKAPAATSAGKPPRVYQLQPKKGISHGYFRSAEGAALAAQCGSVEEALANMLAASKRVHVLLSELRGFALVTFGLPPPWVPPEVFWGAGCS